MRRNDRAAANRAVELIGKHLGMFIDKKQIEISYIDDADEYLARIMEIVNAKVVDNEPAPLQLENDGSEDGSDETCLRTPLISLIYSELMADTVCALA